MEELKMSNNEDADSSSGDQLHIIVLHADVHQMVIKEEASGVDQQDPEPLNIKEELWSLDGEQLDVKEEADATSCSFTTVLFKNEEDEEKPLFSQLNQHQVKDGDVPTSSSADQMTAAAGGEDCGGAGTTRNPDLNTPEGDVSSSETEVSDDVEDGNSFDSQLNLLSDSGSKTKDTDWKDSRAETGVNTDKSFSCSECGKQFYNNRSLQRHVTSHSKTRSSGSLGNEKKNVDSHRKLEAKEKPFSCEDCDKRFTRKEHLNTHVRIHTGQQPYGCDSCERRFRNKISLKTHMRVHTGQKPFGCDVCERAFRDKSSLNKHMRIHTGQKPYGCNVCERRFSVKSSLNAHMRIHTGQKPFVCDVCGKRFTQKANLNAHIRIHTEQKPFGCDVCGRGFSLKSSLNKHIRIHTGQKPFGCDVCGQRFSVKCNLNKHVRIHTGKKEVLNDVLKHK